MARCLGWLLVVISWSGPAFGQAPPAAPFDTPPSTSEPAAPPAASAATQPKPATATSLSDLVVLKNGDRYRGTIVELINDGPVTILLVTGETRKVERAQIVYAGPADREPRTQPAPAPRAAREPDSAPSLSTLPRVRFSSNAKSTEFFYRVPQGYYRRVCIAPCTHDFSPGTYDIGVRIDPDASVEHMRDVLVDQPTSIAADVRRHYGVRAAGGIVLSVSALMIGFSTLYLAAADEPSAGTGAAISTILTGSIGAIVGLSLAFVGDGVSISVTQAP